MAKFKKYGYPLFMGASGLLTTVSDLIQKNEIAVTLAIFLAVVGIITIVTPLNVQQRVFRIVSDGVDEGFSSRAFGSSCLFLAVAVFGFSTLSVKAAPEGGIIASQYPEIQQIQQTLGIMQTDIASIKNTVSEINDKSDKIVAATFPWINLTLHVGVSHNLKEINGKVESVHTPGGSFVSLENNTVTNFENVDIIITNLENKSDYYKKSYDFIGANAWFKGELLSKTKMYPFFHICYSGKIRGRNEWIVDEYDVKISKDFDLIEGNEWYDVRYDKLTYDGPQIFTKEKRCS